MDIFVNELLDSTQLSSTLAIIKDPGYSRLELDEAKGNNLAEQVAKTSPLSSIETTNFMANIDYFPKEDLNLIFNDEQSRAPHRENLY